MNLKRFFNRYKTIISGFSHNSMVKNASVKIIEVNKNSIFKNADLMREHYLNGNLILIRDFEFPIDYTLFDFKAVNLKDKALEVGISEKDIQKTYRKLYKKTNSERAANLIYPNDYIKKNKLLNSMEVVHFTIRNIFLAMFPKITSLRNISTWRMAITKNEDYHIDTYNPTVFRAFYNLSDSERIWGLGHNFIDLIKVNKDKLDSFISENFKEKENSKFNPQLINLKFFNKLLPFEENHLFHFRKKDLWICDSKKVAHQIISGDKLGAITFETDFSEVKKNYPQLIYENHFKSIYEYKS